MKINGKGGKFLNSIGIAAIILGIAHIAPIISICIDHCGDTVSGVTVLASYLNGWLWNLWLVGIIAFSLLIAI